MECQLEKVPVSTYTCLVKGDLNVNLMLANDRSSQNLFNLMLSFDLYPSVNIPTRISESNATLIDNIFMNIGFSDPKVIINDVSDHCAVMVTLEVSSPQNQKKRNGIKLDTASIRKFKCKLASQDWSHLNKYEDPSPQMDKWYGQLTSLLCSSCSKYKQSRKPNKPNKPWITKSLLMCINRRHDLYQEKSLSLNTFNEGFYRRYNNALNMRLRK